MLEEAQGEQHRRRHRQGSYPTRTRRVSRSARAPCPSASKPPATTSSKALQWAQAVGARTTTTVGRGRRHKPGPASCSPPRQDHEVGTARRIGGKGKGVVATDVEGELRESEGRHRCGSNTAASDGFGAGRRGNPSEVNQGSTSGSRAQGGRASRADTGPHDDCTVVGGDRLSAKCNYGDANGYCHIDDHGYSDESFAPDGDNDGEREHREELCKPEAGSSDDIGRRSESEHDVVDAIPSTLVETGRGAD